MKRLGLLPRCFALPLNPCGFGAIVHQPFTEPRVLQGLLGGDAAAWVVDKDTLEEIEELAVKVVVVWNDILPRLGTFEGERLILTSRLFIART
jgi:hypothetical protein